MSSKTRRLATMLAGMLLLTLLVGSAANPAGAAGPPIGTTALEFRPADYPQCAFNGSNRSIRFMVDRIVANSPDRFDADGDPDDEDAPLYRQPTEAERDDFRAGLHALIQDDPDTATQRLAEAGYAACGGDIDSPFFRQTVLVYHPAGLSPTGTEGAPALVLIPGQVGTATVLSGPHLRFEQGVKDQILAALANPSHFTRGAVLSGTHRCNRLPEAPAEYQGSTSVCRGSYRISDMAHNVDTIFQEMHDVLRDEYPDGFHVQLHGMSAAGFSISRGENPADGSAVHPHDGITRAHSHAEVELKGRLAAGGLTGQETTEYINLTSCTPFVHSVSGVPAPVRKLHCGTRNAQLDRERGSGDPDRFIHLEQSPYIRSVYPDYIRAMMSGL